MLACSMAHNAYAQTLGHKETVRQRNVIMVVQVTRTSKCAEGWDILTFLIENFLNVISFNCL